MIEKQLLNELKKLLPEKIYNDDKSLKSHSCNQFYTTGYTPDAICHAESEDDVKQLVQFCINNKIPLIPYGSGTSVEGHLAALNGGICVNMTKMNKILEFNPADEYVIVEAGIAYNKLNEFLDTYGYHFPVEAGWGASIGGMMSTNASGAGAVDAGSMSKNIFGCHAVVYDENYQAQLIKTGTLSQKSSAGYNLNNLFIGAEGTLGVITQVILKIRKNFECTNTISCQFDDLKDAIKFVIEMKPKVNFRRVELLDKLQTDACLNYSKITCLDNNKNTLLIELGGNKHSVAEERLVILDYLKHNKGLKINYFMDKLSAQPLWTMRKNACPAAIKYLGPDKKAMATDTSVPLSKLTDCINACYQHMSLKGINAPMVAHVGDGNFHFTVLVDVYNQLEICQAKEFNASIVEEALKHGGTCTGEHGIGNGKKSYLEKEHSDSLFLMQKMKKIFDPLNIFNPGKIVDLNVNPKFNSKFARRYSPGVF